MNHTIIDEARFYREYELPSSVGDSVSTSDFTNEETAQIIEQAARAREEPLKENKMEKIKIGDMVERINRPHNLGMQVGDRSVVRESTNDGIVWSKDFPGRQSIDNLKLVSKNWRRIIEGGKK